MIHEAMIQVRLLPGGTWILLHPVEEKGGVSCVALSPQSPWLSQLCWSHKTIQTSESEAVKTVVRRWLTLAKEKITASADANRAQDHAKARSIGKRAVLADSSDEGEGEEPSSVVVKPLKNESIGKWVEVPALPNDDETTIMIYPGRTGAFIRPDGPTRAVGERCSGVRECVIVFCVQT